MKSGIYQIENQVTGIFYIGCSANISNRLRQHKYSLRANKHINKQLQADFNQYGEENFKFSVLEYFNGPKYELLDREGWWIYVTEADTLGYNTPTPASVEHKFKRQSELIQERAMVYAQQQSIRMSQILSELFPN